MEGPIQHLPLELKIYFTQFLQVNELVNLRSTSRLWSIICTEEVFRNGITIRPHYNDMERLLKISECSWLAKSVEKVVILVGDMDTAEMMRAFLLNQAGQESELGSQHRSEILDIVHNIDKAPFKIRHCDEDALVKAFGRFPNLKSLSASSCMFPFKELDVRFKFLWETMIMNVRRGHGGSFQDGVSAIFNYAAIISASRAIPNKVRTLSLDLLPLDCLEEFQLYSNSQFSDVQCLQIGFTRSLTDPTRDDNGEVNIPETAGAVGSFFGAMTHLRTLDLSWGVDRSQPHWDQITVCEVILQGVFYSAMWPNLEILRIYRMKTEAEPLLRFLSKHTSLKWLSLQFSIQPDEDCTFKEMLSRFRSELRLERFELIAHESQQCLYDTEWRAVEGVESADARALEKFVLNRSPYWPMDTDDPTPLGWTQKHDLMKS